MGQERVEYFIAYKSHGQGFYTEPIPLEDMRQNAERLRKRPEVSEIVANKRVIVETPFDMEVL